MTEMRPRWARRVPAHVFVGLAVAAGIAGAAAQDLPPVRSVPAVDLSRYAGTWFEVARYPNWFQKHCASDVTAEYVLLPDRRIRVVNTCRRNDGSIDKAEGVARLANPGGPTSRLKVRFAPAFLSFIPAVWGDYWVIGLPPDYSYAVVGDPSRRYLWILSRTKTLDPGDYQKAVDAAAANGFDPKRLVRTVQSP
jgi:apolipoprotein D and lipocalin family protein